MSAQIAIRLPDDLLAFIDEEIRAGRAKDRASLVRTSDARPAAGAAGRGAPVAVLTRDFMVPHLVRVTSSDRIRD